MFALRLSVTGRCIPRSSLASSSAKRSVGKGADFLYLPYHRYRRLAALVCRDAPGLLVFGVNQSTVPEEMHR